MYYSLPDFSLEKEAYDNGYSHIAGIDEAGRGAIAGPVVAAAVILPLNIELKGIDDSKRLSPKKRELAYALIQRKSLAIGVGIVSEKEIDRINILRATIKAMEMAIEDLRVPPDYLLIDALHLDNAGVPQRAVVHGDALSISIASASIIAKVTRDRFMVMQHEVFPEYNFITHKGYATKEHVERLRQYGPSAIHRRSFIKKILS